MTELKACPECGGELHHQHDHWLCDSCHHSFVERFHCDKCGSMLEKLKACGAVDFFCNSCNELKSKRSLVSKLVAKVS
ncbi:MULTISPECIES: zinc ribbon domain-containing protein [Aliagarivorans]|uniref:zinc ribbon domain-containing protein n=1 Tax=Aliagarivorans TaxID=882379 RepID=UPI00041AEA45|nr:MULTISPECIES: zinc ribbon domain-containing protein [Aliagarivorans]